jgi:hypothetical protein
MKIVMTILVRNEEDIIRENLEFHLAQGIDQFIVTDHSSQDGTPDILHEYEKVGVLKYIKETGDYSQSKWVTKMARLAYTMFSADWVINNDADEFWWHNSGSIKDALSKIPPEFSIVHAIRHNMLLHPEKKNLIFYKDMVLRRRISLNPIGNPLPGKVCSRGAKNLTVLSGSHRILHPEWTSTYNSEFEIFHYPFRNFKQLKEKVINIGSGYENNPQIDKTTGTRPGIAMRTIYNEYLKNPESLLSFYNQCFAPTSTRIQIVDLEQNTIMEDLRISQFLSNLMKQNTEN